jgi:hypothetical protein
LADKVSENRTDGAAGGDKKNLDHAPGLSEEQHDSNQLLLNSYQPVKCEEIF